MDCPNDENPMRPDVSWIRQTDERILEFLSEKDLVASPGVIAANIDSNPNYISRRCRVLRDGGLIQLVDSTNYRITDLGKQFLQGALDADDLEPAPD